MDKAEAVANAARLLRVTESAYRQTYGSASNVALDLAKAWTELARVIGEPDA